MKENGERNRDNVLNDKLVRGLDFTNAHLFISFAKPHQPIGYPDQMPHVALPSPILLSSETSTITARDYNQH